MEINSASGQEAVGESLQRYCSTRGTPPLLLFPEEDTTNGRAGLLKFRSDTSVAGSVYSTFKSQEIRLFVCDWLLIDANANRK